ncbi:MAG: hypothetical protein QGF46_01680 [Planctomycetota bacterium]|jgi:hypothetical protein|nr:hypothetical protein [Planctomycetota bacterium]
MVTATELFATHDSLVNLLTAHKRAIIDGDLQQIQFTIVEFDCCLNAHSRCEDELLIPYFVELNLESNGCTADLLQKEHVKLRRLSAEARERSHAPNLELDIDCRISLFENLHMLGEVLEHHDQRERAGFLCKFDEKLSDSELCKLVSLAIEHERALYQK